MRVPPKPDQHERDQLRGQARHERVFEEDHVDESVVDLRIGGQLQPAAVAAGVRETCREPMESAPLAVDCEDEVDGRRSPDRADESVQVDPVPLDAASRIGVVLHRRVQAEADIADADEPVEVEGVDGKVISVGDDGDGRLDVLRNAELRNEIIAAATGNDAQGRLRPEESGTDGADQAVSTERDDEGRTAAGELGGELPRVRLAAALDNLDLQAPPSEGGLHRPDPPPHLSVTGGRVEDHRQRRRRSGCHS